MCVKDTFFLSITHKRTKFILAGKAMLILALRAAKKCGKVLIVLKCDF